MKQFFLGSLVLIFLVVKGWANEVSLIEDDLVGNEILNSQSNQLDIQTEDEDSNEKEVQDSDYEQMNDFLQEEDQKLKDIKLLNLDLEKASLELKKKEIEQKLSQFNQSDGILPSDNSKPSIKLIGVFENSQKKEAVLNINGVNKKLIEGQVFNGMVVESISNQVVVVGFDDGLRQELSL